jgi:Haem-binding uptake, Tiki superfamily, ChaN
VCPQGAWVYPGSDKKRDDVIVALAKRGVVLLGESHDQAEHRRWQLRTITALFSHRPDMVLGFEMFPRRVQPVLDRWSNGELDETAFLRDIHWTQIWGFAEELYLPLIHFARVHQLPMLALNIDRATNRRVAAQGLAHLPSTEREGVGNPAPASAFYRDRPFESFNKHPAAGRDAHAPRNGSSVSSARSNSGTAPWPRGSPARGPYRKSGPHVLMVQPTKHRPQFDTPLALSGPSIGRILP